MRSSRYKTTLTTLMISILFLSSMLFATPSGSKGKIPVCEGKNGQPLALNASEVIKWKHTTPNKFESRAHIQGKVSKLYADKNGHRHFEITFSDKVNEDTIEIVYNESFGKIPELELDMSAEACGDYITATAVSGPYPPSPDGAIIHWVHESTSSKGHPHGFVVLEGLLYGYDRSKSGKNNRTK